ncbi:FAD binding domain-containing protein [Apodospora peruviana]|uniref:FAD binding domain-containing protein n=1 Tax=Apodospora peruviana TaxID=516989 RepID=A0AAE0MB08_9PEZI|nr:FAD binding domain-containing protein [Apodospora peruviana]
MSDFKVIIVGAGPVGLAAGHCFSQAGISYEILERREKLDANQGASAALWPNTARIFAQLGLLEEALQIYFPQTWKANMLQDGTVSSKSDVMAMPEVYHGYPWMLFARPRLVDLLQRRLPGGSSRIHTGKEITAVETTSTGVKVCCADGTDYEGSIVLGADGVNSTVRRLMDDKIAAARTGAADEKSNLAYQSQLFKSTTVGVYGYCDGRIPGVERGTWYETHADGFTFQLAGGDDMTLFLLYERLPEPITVPARHRFSDQDKDAFVARNADYHIAPTVTIRDLMAQTKWSYMSHLEEGVIDTWHHDRIVLAGDAVAKMTPNSGFGINTGIQSVVAITNALRRVLEKTDEPDNAALTGAFDEYVKTRRENVEKTVKISGMHTRIAVWDSWWMRFVDKYIVPWTNGYMSMRRMVAPVVQEGLVLDFVEEKDYREGTVKWTVPRVMGEQEPFGKEEV